jgi:hypothetical protein
LQERRIRLPKSKVWSSKVEVLSNILSTRAIDSRAYKSSRLLAGYIIYIDSWNNVEIKAYCTRDFDKNILLVVNVDA